MNRFRYGRFTGGGGSIVPGLLLVSLIYLAEVASGSDVTTLGAFFSGQYRNLFVEAGRSQQEVTNKIYTAFQNLFHGDPQSEAVYFSDGTNADGLMAFIYDINSRDVRSEGMSYGMMIAVQLDRKAEFNAIWNWAKVHMYQSSTNHPACGYFAWSLSTNGVPNDEMPAPDGEEYFVMSLYFAAHRWGNGAGIFNYQTEADQLLTNMRHRKPIRGQTAKGVMVAGAIFEPNLKLVRFTPDTANWEHTDPSYQLPAFYELWAEWGPSSDRAFWAAAADASREFLFRAANYVTALTPDYANFDATPWAAPWNRLSTDFQADAWRTAMNWSVDWAWSAKYPRERQLSDRLQAFFEAQGISSYGNRFSLDGKPQSTTHSPGLVAMNAVASLAATQPRARKFVDELWSTPVPTGQYRYYDGMLYLLGLLHCGGQFRIWGPR
jgi:oligosaccharide reducing-end xylanase